MAIWQAILLGLVQGFTSFLPVSSSGHLSLMEHILGTPESGTLLTMMFHLGALAAVIAIFWKDLWMLVRQPRHKLMYMMLIATVPLLVSILLLGGVFASAYQQSNVQGLVLAIGFLITGLALFAAGQFFDNGEKKLKQFCWKESGIIGLSQILAVIPGISRFGSTLSAAMASGLERPFALRFALLLSAPSLLISVLCEGFMLIGSEAVPTVDFWGAIMGLLAAMLAGYAAIRLLLKILARGKLQYFAYYLGGLTVLLLLDQFVFRLFF